MKIAILDTHPRNDGNNDTMRARVTPDDGFEALLEPFYNGKSLTDPISTKEDKFQLLPAFLKVKGKLSSLRQVDFWRQTS